MHWKRTKGCIRVLTQHWVGTRCQRRSAVGGTVFPSTDDGMWQNLNDESDDTFAQTMPSQFAFLELDLGAGGQMVDRVRVRHINNTDDFLRSNDTTLYVLDDERRVVLQYSITNLKADSPLISDFVVKNAVVDPPYIPSSDIRTVRYLRLARFSGRDYMNEQSLEGLLGSRTDACIPFPGYATICHQRYMADTGRVTNVYNFKDWIYLNDGNVSTYGATEQGLNNIMELDFGDNGKQMNRVRVVHCTGAMDRSNGVAVSAIDTKGTVLFQYAFANVTESSPMVVLFDMTGKVVAK